MAEQFSLFPASVFSGPLKIRVCSKFKGRGASGPLVGERRWEGRSGFPSNGCTSISWQSKLSAHVSNSCTNISWQSKLSAHVSNGCTSISWQSKTSEYLKKKTAQQKSRSVIRADQNKVAELAANAKISWFQGKTVFFPSIVFRSLILAANNKIILIQSKRRN